MVVAVVGPIATFTINSLIIRYQFERLPPELRQRLEERRLSRERRGDPAPNNFASALERSTLFAALGSTALGLTLAFLLSRRLARPYELVGAAARRIAQGELGARVPEDLPYVGGEAATLVHDFNRMAQTLEASEAERRRLMADIAHDLRTPLSILQARLDGFMDGVLPLNMDEVKRLSQQTTLLTRLVEDVRVLSLADAGRLTVDLDQVNLGALVEDMVSSFEDRAAAKRIELNFLGEVDLPPVYADADRVAQIISNLLDNAIRYTPGGGRIDCRAEWVEDSPGVCLSVSDTGIGIAPEALPHIFDRFYREHSARSQASGGSGLGLAIVKALTELHGGRVRARNLEEGGARFEVWLPPGQAPS
nr:ATP-binding protein [Deinobacterium chartae]